MWQAAIDETAEALSERQDERMQQEEVERQAAIKETAKAILEGFFGWALPGRDTSQQQIDFHNKMKAIEEKRQARDGGAPLKEGWQVKDFRLMYDRDRQR